MCKETAVRRTASMDEIENFPYEFESISRSVSSSSSIAGEGGETISYNQENGGTPLNYSSKTPPILFNEMLGVFTGSNGNLLSYEGNTAATRGLNFSPIAGGAMMPVRTDSKQSIQDIENLCRSLADSKSTGGNVNVMTSISISPTLPTFSSRSVHDNNDNNNIKLDDNRPPGFTRLPSFGTEFKPAYLYTQQEESQVESLIGLTFDEQTTSYDIGLSIDGVISPKVVSTKTIATATKNEEEAKLETDMPLVAETKSSSFSYSSILTESETHKYHPHPQKQQKGSKSIPLSSTDHQNVVNKVSNGGVSNYNNSCGKGWHPDADDTELFDCVLNIMKSYTLGVKDIIGLRQVLRNKFGDAYVNRFNKKLSSRSLLWRYNENETRLKELVKVRSRKFTLVIKNETSMFYLCTPDIIPDGFSRWVPRSDPNWTVANVIIPTPSIDDNSKKGSSKKQSQPTKASKGSRYLDEQTDVTFLAQPVWKGSK